MELFFEKGNEGQDFMAICELPGYLKALDPDGERLADVRFWAYDTSAFADWSERDAMLNSAGIQFDCEIRIEFAVGGPVIYLAEFPARNRQEAEHLFKVAADALYR